MSRRTQQLTRVSRKHEIFIGLDDAHYNRARIGGMVSAAEALRSGSSERPIHSSPRAMRSRIGALCSPMPPVKMSVSSPPRVTINPPSDFFARYQNRAIAVAACGSVASRASRSRISELVPETPSKPAWRLTSRSRSSAVVPGSRRRCKRTPGSRSPVRVPIINPPAGENPIVVPTLAPRCTAVRLAPLPRCAITIRPRPQSGRYGRWRS